MQSSIKIDFVGDANKGLQPVIKIRQEYSDDPRDGLLQEFFHKLRGQSSWLSVSFGNFVEDPGAGTKRRFITLSPVTPDELPETMSKMKEIISESISEKENPK